MRKSENYQKSDVQDKTNIPMLISQQFSREEKDIQRRLTYDIFKNNVYFFKYLGITK